MKSCFNKGMCTRERNVAEVVEGEDGQYDGFSFVTLI